MRGLMPSRTSWCDRGYVELVRSEMGVGHGAKMDVIALPSCGSGLPGIRALALSFLSFSLSKLSPSLLSFTSFRLSILVPCSHPVPSSRLSLNTLLSHAFPFSGSVIYLYITSSSTASRTTFSRSVSQAMACCLLYIRSSSFVERHVQILAYAILCT